MLPCQHNACDSCIVEGDDGKGQVFTCPIDYTTISGLINADRNNALFMKVKLRERKFALMREAEIREMNRKAEAVLKLEEHMAK